MATPESRLEAHLHLSSVSFPANHMSESASTLFIRHCYANCCLKHPNHKLYRPQELLSTLIDLAGEPDGREDAPHASNNLGYCQEAPAATFSDMPSSYTPPIAPWTYTSTCLINLMFVLTSISTCKSYLFLARITLSACLNVCLLYRPNASLLPVEH
jgi:hypothetical protein